MSGIDLIILDLLLRSLHVPRPFCELKLVKRTRNYHYEHFGLCKSRSLRIRTPAVSCPTIETVCF